MSHDSMASIRKLQGRSNWDTWKFAVQTYLEHEDLWGAVTGESDDATKSRKARSKIILLIDEINYTHVKNAKTAKETWECLEKVFDDSGLCRRVGLLDAFCNTRLVNCKSVEEYVDKISSAAHSLNGTGFEVNQEWIGTMLLFGLPDEYKPMVMAIGSSGTKITEDTIKSKILQDVKIGSGSSNSALYSRNVSSTNKQKIRCFNCKNRGHYANNCPNRMSENSKKPDGKKGALFTSFMASVNSSSDDWYLDSGASAHMATNKELFVKINDSSCSEVVTANNNRLKVKAVGDVELNVQNGSVDVKNWSN